MAFMDFFKFRKSQPVQVQPSEPKKTVVGASDVKDEIKLTAFDNSNITYSSELSSVDYDSLLRNKEQNITTLYQLADYYTDADPIVRGIIKGVYVPFTSTDWYLTCDNEKTIELFEEQYRKMRLREHIDEIFLQYYKYNNVFVYVWDGNIMTLPPHKCRIGNIAINGTPSVDFDVQDIQNEFRQKTYSVLEQKGVKDNAVEDILKTYPPEVQKALREGAQYAQMDMNNMYVLQGSKEGWTRYAIPWISAALPALARKELIGKYETSLLNIGARPFVHVTYGDSTKGQDILPGMEELTQVRNLFSRAMSGSPLAVTNPLAKANVVQADLNSLYQWPMYDEVNNDILASGGISGIIVNGRSEDGSTFASAQVSTQSATSRIEAARKEFEEFMNRLNVRLVEDIRLIHTNNLKNIPQFHFVPFDANGQKALREACMDLWSKGVVSTRTMLEAHGYSLTKEKSRREQEASDGTNEVLTNREQQAAKTEGTGKVGRPQLDSDERNSDPENAIRSKQAKDAADGDLETEKT